MHWSILFRRFWCFEDSVDWIARFIFSPFHATLVWTKMSWFITRIDNGWDSRMGFSFLSSRNLPWYLHDNTSLPPFLWHSPSPVDGCTDAAVCRVLTKTSVFLSTYRKRGAKYVDYFIAMCPYGEKWTDWELRPGGSGFLIQGSKGKASVFILRLNSMFVRKSMLSGLVPSLPTPQI